MQTPLNRGDVYYCDLDPAFGCEQGGTRPVLIVQNNIGNAHSTTTIVAAITHKDKPVLPTHVALNDVAGLNDGSVVLLEQLRTVDKNRLAKQITVLNESQMRPVDIALAASIGIHTPPQTPMLMSLCRACAQTFRDSRSYRVKQVDLSQDTKESCTICNIRTGYDFEVTRL